MHHLVKHLMLCAFPGQYGNQILAGDFNLFREKLSRRRNYYFIMGKCSVDWAYCYILLAFEGGIIVAAFLLNSVQVTSMLRRRKTKIPFDISVLGVCVADLIASIILLSDAILTYMFFTKKLAESDLDIVLIFFLIGFYFSMAISFYLTLFIAIQRLLAVYLPLKFRIYFTRRRCCYCLAFAWTMSFLTTMQAYLWDFRIFAFGLITCGCLLIVCYIAICCTVYKRQKLYSAVAQNQNQRSRRTLMHCVSITITFIVCTFPFAISTTKMKEMHILPGVNTFLMILNPLFNSLLYFVSSRSKQRNCCTFHCCCCCCIRLRKHRVQISEESERGSGCFVLTKIHREYPSCRVNENYVNEP